MDMRFTAQLLALLLVTVAATGAAYAPTLAPTLVLSFCAIGVIGIALDLAARR
jgi:hypothetical protein